MDLFEQMMTRPGHYDSALLNSHGGDCTDGFGEVRQDPWRRGFVKTDAPPDEVDMDNAMEGGNANDEIPNHYGADRVHWEGDASALHDTAAMGHGSRLVMRLPLRSKNGWRKAGVPRMRRSLAGIL